MVYLFRMSLKRNKIISHQSGSALIMVLFLAAAVSAGAFYLMRLSHNVESQIKIISKSEKYLRINEILREQFEDPQICTAILSGKSLGGALTANGVSLLPITTNLLGSTEVLNDGWRSPVGNKLKDIRLKLENTLLRTGLKRDSLTSPNIDVVNGEIYISTYEGTPSLNVARHSLLKVKVMVYVNSGSHTLYACFSSTGGPAMCTLSGGIYNSYGTGTRPKCEPYSRCHLDGQGIVSDPTLCSNPFSAIRTGPATYFCQWCNRNF